MVAKITELFGTLVIDDVYLGVKLNMAVDEVVDAIQRKFDVRKISSEMMAVMNCWIRTQSWYVNGLVSKFERCLEEAVVDEMREFIINFLERRSEELEDGVLNEDHLFDAVKRATRWLSRLEDWETDGDLTNGVIWWAQYYGDRILQCDYEHTFSWFSNETRTTHYYLPHVPIHLKNIDSELLPDDFQHEEEWDCPICLEADAENPSCVRTACAHIFHGGCLDKCKRAYFELAENYHKECSPCPLCRASIN